MDERDPFYEDENNRYEEFDENFRKYPANINVEKSASDVTDSDVVEILSIETSAESREEELPDDVKSIPRMVRQVVTLGAHLIEPCFNLRVVVLSIKIFNREPF